MKTEKKAILQKGRGEIRKQARLTYIYEKESRYFAQMAESIKDIAIKELKELGAGDVRPVFRGAWFKASQKNFYKIVYFTRLCSKILAPLITFKCKDKNDVYKAAKKIRWEEFLTPEKTFSIIANVSESDITHSGFAGLRVKDAIADYFRDRTNKRPNVDAKDPFIIINLYVRKKTATLSVDASGGPLHKRGYREARVLASMQETVAAAVIRLSEWDGETPLYDPMCGSGTLLCEALMSHCRIPAQVFRNNFGFERLPDFNSKSWKKIKQDSQQNYRILKPGLIAGSDISAHSVNASKINVMGLHFGREVHIEQMDFQSIEPRKKSMIVVNPPDGIRMDKGENLNSLYKNLGVFLKERCRQSLAFVYFGAPRYIKKVPLAPAWKRPLNIGGLDGKLVKYALY